MTTHPIPSHRRTVPVPTFDNARVADVMRYGLITCSPEADLKDVARTMVTNQIHAVIIKRLEPNAASTPWGVVSDLDVLGTAHPGGTDMMACEAAATPAVTVASDESLARAAQLMREYTTSHLIVVDRVTDEPLGVISTLDVASALAWGGR
jgi:CBS domain-containing protein